MRVKVLSMPSVTPSLPFVVAPFRLRALEPSILFAPLPWSKHVVSAAFVRFKIYMSIQYPQDDACFAMGRHG